MKIAQINSVLPLKVGQSTLEKKSTQEQQTVTNPITKEQNSNVMDIYKNYFKASQALNPSFFGHSCSTASFKPKTLPSMPCACCGRPMVTRKQTEEFAQKAGNATGNELADVLDSFKDHFRASERAVANFAIKEARKNESATLKSIVSSRLPDSLVLLEEEQKDVLNRMSKLAKQELGEKNPVQNCVERGLNLVSSRSKNEYFQRKPYLKEVLKSLESVENKEVAGKILDIAVQLPTSEKNIDAFIAKYSRRDSQAIANRLVANAIVTAEHIHPKSKGGPNNTANYIGECQECNGHRGNMPMNDWWEENYPNMPRSAQRNIDKVTEEIINNKIGGNYEDWAVDVKKALFKETEGKISVKVLNPEEIKKARAERGLPPVSENKKEMENAAKSPASKKKVAKKDTVETEANEVKTGKKKTKRKAKRQHLTETSKFVRTLPQATLQAA